VYNWKVCILLVRYPQPSEPFSLLGLSSPIYVNVILNTNQTNQKKCQCHFCVLNVFYDTPYGREQSYRLSTVALQPIHGKITLHYSQYCALAFVYLHKCELSYMMLMMLNCIRTQVKLYGIGLVLVKTLT